MVVGSSVYVVVPSGGPSSIRTRGSSTKMRAVFVRARSMSSRLRGARSLLLLTATHYFVTFFFFPPFLYKAVLQSSQVCVMEGRFSSFFSLNRLIIAFFLQFVATVVALSLSSRWTHHGV